ncbi:MAG: CocE/NonD family hydrolase [Bacteroidetes bacterium]|nr:CocE/NonD family hydrolase [Bacteroidota bacterium]
MMRFRQLALLFLGFVCCFGAFEAQGQNVLNGKIDAISEFSTRQTIPFTMPDGIKLSTDVFIPQTQDCMLVNITLPLPGWLGGTTNLGDVMLIPNRTQIIFYDSIGGQLNPNPYQLPVVFTRTPYDKTGDITGEYVCLFGYASVMQDMRGRYASEGVYMPMYSDSWDKNPYHPNYGHVLDVTDLSDPRNGNRHEDGYNSIKFIIDSLFRDYGNLPHTSDKMTTGDIAMFGASALGNSQYQAAAAHRIDPDPTKPGLKALFPIVATLEHYRYTGYQNGVFRDRIVTGWLKGQIFTGTDDDLNDIDNDIDNTLHSATDYGLPNKFDAANKAIDHFSTVQYNDEPCGYYPTSRGRADMDASAAPVDANGEGDPNGQFSRYTNLKVPAYHLSGWWDIFTDGQIDTWQRMRQYNEPGIRNLQKLIIGPWAHQTTGGRTTGDRTYPENVGDLIGINLDDFGNNLDLGKAINSEIVGWFRYNLNYIPGRELGEPKVIIPESQIWQDVGSNLFQVRVPSADLVLPLQDLINFIIGEGDLQGVPVEVKENLFGNTLPFTIPVPNLGPLIPDIAASPMGAIPFKDFSQGVPAVRMYVPGPVDDGVAANQGVGNYWFAADTFPMVQHIRWTPKYLHQDGRMDDAAPVADEGYKLFVHDPDNPIATIGGSNMIVRTPDGTRDSQGQFNLADPRYAPYTMDREGVIAFETDALNDTMTIMGFPVMNLYAKTNPAGPAGPTDTDFNVRVLDVYPDGSQYFVFEGAVNARARLYAKHMADHGVEKADIPFNNIESGQIYQYKFRMLPIAYTWGIDHKVKILISSSNYTRYQVNPNLPIEDGEFFRRKPGDGQTYMYNGVEMAPRVAVQRVHFSPEHPAYINLPVYDPNFFVGEAEAATMEMGTDMLIYPNPTRNIATVHASKPGNYRLQVFNAIGQLVIDGDMREQMELEMGAMQSGVYFVKMIDQKTGKSASEKLVVQK